MLKFLTRLIILVAIAWFLSPLLSVILPYPSSSGFDGFLGMSTESSQKTLPLARFVLWLVVLALLFKYTRPLINFVFPISRRFSTTKLFRRFQGLASYFIAFGILFLTLSIVLGISGARSKYLSTYAEEEEELYDSLSNSRLIVGIGRMIVENEREARSYLESLDYDPTYQREWTNTSYQSDKWVDQRPWPLDSNRPLEEFEQDIAGMGDAWSPDPDIRIDEYYLKLYRRQVRLYGELRTLNDEVETLKSNWEDESQDKAFVKEVKQRTWARIGTPFSLTVYYARELKTLTQIISLIVLIVLIVFRSGLGRLFEKVIRFLEQGRFGFGGSARFAGLIEEWGSRFKDQKQGLFMGRSLYNPLLNIGLEDSRHMLTIAGSRAGKGTTSIIPNLLLWEGSTLVVDPKGTNAAVTARRRRNMGQDVYIVDPFNILEDEESASFNPLEYLDPESPTIREQINIITEALVVPDQHQRERHWDDGAKTVIAGMIAHLVSSPQYKRPTLSMLRDLISALPDEQVSLWADMSLNEGAGRLAKDAANRIIQGIGTNEISSIISNADKHTEWLSSPAMQKTLKTSSFSFSEIKDRPTTIYLILPPEYLETHNRFLRLFINLVINQLSIGGRSKTPILLLMDEFLALGRMQEVEKAFGLMAGYNLVMWPFVQDLGRLKDLYGKSVNAFVANSRAVQVFGVSDEETKEFVSNNIGERFLGTVSKVAERKNVVKLRTPTEVSMDVAVETNRQYVLRSGKAPFILEKVSYYKGEPIRMLRNFPVFNEIWKGLFAGLYDRDPDYLDEPKDLYELDN